MNLVRWIIEPHRMSPDRWVTLREVYRSTLDPERIERKIAEVEALVGAVWLTLDPKLRSSIIEGLSVFLSVFDLPDVAATFCPPKPAREQAGSPADPPTPPCSPAAVARRLPPLDQVIDEGKVLAFEHVRGDRPRLGNRPGRNETSTLYRRGGAARQASRGAVAVGDAIRDDA